MNTKSLKKRLFAILGLAVLIPLFALALSMHYQVKDSREQALLEYKMRAVTLARILEERFYDNQTELEIASAAITSARTEMGEQQENSVVLMSILDTATDRYSQTIGLDSEGRLKYWSSLMGKAKAEELALKIADTWIFRQTFLTGRSVVGQITREHDWSRNPSVALYLCTPVFDYENISRVREVLVRWIDLAELLTSAAGTYLEPGVGMRLIDSEDTVIAVYGQWDSQGKLISSAPLSFPEGQVQLAVAKEQLLTESNLMVSIGVLGGSLVLLFCGFLVSLHFKNLSLFFDQLIGYINAINAGDLTSLGNKPKTQDAEAVSILSKFRDMAISLDKSHKEIKKINAELEDRVVERTLELKRKNTQLLAVNSLLKPMGSFQETADYSAALLLMRNLLNLKEINLSRAASQCSLPAFDERLPGGLYLHVVPAQALTPNQKEMLEQFIGFLSMALDNDTLFRRTAEQHAALSSVLGAMLEGFALTLDGESYLYSNENFRKYTSFPEVRDEVLVLRKRFFDAAQSGTIQDQTEPIQVHTQQEEMKKVFAVRFFAVDLPRSSTEKQTAMALLVSDITREYEIGQLKDDVVALASHELNNPVTSIRLGLETLVKRGDRISADLQKQLLTSLFEQSERLHCLIHDWLDLSMLNNGVLTCHIEKNELVSTVSHTVADWQRRNGILVDFVCPVNSVNVMMDPQRLAQVINNLLDNAKRYNDKDKPDIKVEMSTKGDEIHIDVSDNGIGVALGETKQIFEHFYRGDDAKRCCPNGSGLGLSICRAIMNEHQGTLKLLQSTPGEGTTFRVTLPILQQ